MIITRTWFWFGTLNDFFLYIRWIRILKMKWRGTWRRQICVEECLVWYIDFTGNIRSYFSEVLIEFVSDILAPPTCLPLLMNGLEIRLRLISFYSWYPKFALYRFCILQTHRHNAIFAANIHCLGYPLYKFRLHWLYSYSGRISGTAMKFLV